MTKWGSSSLSCIYFMLCVAENHKHGTHDRVTCQCTWPYSIASFQPRFINPGPSLHPAENMSCLEKLQLFMTHDHQSGYFVRRINLVFGGTWDSEEIYIILSCVCRPGFLQPQNRSVSHHHFVSPTIDWIYKHHQSPCPPIPSPAMKMFGIEVRFVFLASSARSSLPFAIAGSELRNITWHTNR